MLDKILRGGLVVDGTGSQAYCSDVGIKDGCIEVIGDLSDASSHEIYEVSGKLVVPGFVDLHTHSDFTLLVNSKAESQIHQGVTTEVVGQCGFSCAPVRSSDDVKALALGHCDGVVDASWRTFGEYLDALDAARPAINVAALVGHGALFRAVVGNEARQPTPKEVQAMSDLLDESLEQGACGLSTGLEYWPGNLCAIEQIVPLCRVVQKHDGLYATHVRNRDYYFDVAFAEAIATSRQSGAKLEISHIQTKYGAPEYAIEQTLSVVEAARQRGVDVAFDVIPDEWAHTSIVAILPKWAQEGGASEILARLRDKKLRSALKKNPSPIWKLVTDERWEDILLLHSKANPRLVGKSFAEIGELRNTDPYDAALDLLYEEGDALYHAMWTSRSFREVDIDQCLKDDACSVISDTLALAPYGDLAEHIGSLSGYGWTAQFLDRYVAQKHLLSVEDAIRRITSVPARRMGLTDRGELRPGLKADIAVLESEQIRRLCTVQEPRLYPTGFSHVFVNGELALSPNGRSSGHHGEVIRAH